MNNPRDLINQRIKGHFTPTELISRAEVAFTFKGIDARSQQPIVIKYYPPHPSAPQLMDEVMRAVRFQAQQRSPRTLSVLDFDAHPMGGVWEAIELHAGPSLLRAVRAKGRLGAPQVAALLGALCDALEPLHAEGRFHGNLKPTNVFLNEQLSPRALRLSDATGSGLSGVHKVGEARVTFNDPSFFTHEQASSKDLTPAVDIGALGLLGYFMLTGRFPFEGRSTDKVLAEVLIKSGRLEVKPDEVEGAPAEVEALLRLVNSCLAKSPAKRPATLSLVREGLLEVGVSAAQGQRPSVMISPVNTIAPGDPLTALGRLGPLTTAYEASTPTDLSMLEAARQEYQAQVMGGGASSTPTPIGLTAIAELPFSNTSASQTLISTPRASAPATLISAMPPLEPSSAAPEPAPRFSWGGEGDDEMSAALSALAAEMGLGAEEQASRSWGGESGRERGDDLGDDLGGDLGGDLGDELLGAEPTPPEEMSFSRGVELFSDPVRLLPPEPVSGEFAAYQPPPTSPDALGGTLNLKPPSLSQTISSSTYLEDAAGGALFPQLPGWQSLMALRGDPAALAQALSQVPLPLTGHLLPFSQFQLQLEGAQLAETFFADVPKLTLPPLLAAGAGAPDPLVESSPSLAVSLTGASARVEAPSAPQGRHLPGWAVALALAVTLAGGAYMAGVNLEVVRALVGGGEEFQPPPPRAPRAPRAPGVPGAQGDRLAPPSPLRPPALEPARDPALDEPSAPTSGARLQPKPAPLPASQSGVKPGVTPAVTPAVKPAVKPAALPAMKPVSKPAAPPPVKPAAKPRAKPKKSETPKGLKEVF